MVIWGGYDNVNSNIMQVTADGAAYNPTTNAWQLLPASPLTARADPQALWTGRAVMILGGQPAVTTATTAQYSDGALYDPSTARWSLITSPPTQDGHNVGWVASVAVGPTVLAWSNWSEVHRVGPNTSSMSGGVDLFGYDPATGAWRYRPVGPLALPAVEDAIWTGQDLYTRGITYNCGLCPGPFVPEATAVYDASANTWARLPADPLGGDHLLSVWTGAALFSFNPSGIYGSIGPGDASVYDPSTNTWARTPGAPFACDSATDPVWTGQQVLLYCPRPASGGGAGHDGLAYTPAASNQVRLLVNVAVGCPPSIIGYRDVVSTFAGPLLVPADPNGGLVCRYHPTGGVPSQNAGRVAEQTRLDATQASELSEVIRQLDLRAPTGTYSCPADIGTVVLIGFSYRARADVGLWYAASGCQTLDNGRIGAFEPGNSSFYLGFQETIDRLSPPVSL